MATFTYRINGKKRNLVPIYLRLSNGKLTDLIVKSGLFVNPTRWSNFTQTIKQRIKTDDDEMLIKNLKNLKDYIEIEFKGYFGEYSKEWLQSVIDRFFNKKSVDARNLNDYISLFIQEAKDGVKKSKSARNYASGTVRVFEGLRNVLNEYQGIYSDKRLKQIERENKRLKAEGNPLKKLRPLRILDFESVNVDFYNSFVNFISDEGYALNTQGRFIKCLKIIMKKSLQEKLHNNREFQYDAFRGIKEDGFAIALTPDELDKLYNIDLSQSENKWLELAKDAWFILYETCLRISDYKQIDLNIRELDGKRIIDIYQTKTKKRVLIPMSARFAAIWEKYQHSLPVITDQYINKHIKTVAFMAGIDRKIRWPVVLYGKTFERTAKAWEKISCHTSRRSGATVLWKEGVPLSDIMILLGHATEKQTREYIKITAEEAVLRLASHPHYSNHFTVVKAG